MKNLEQYIKEELSNLSEKKYKAPPEIIDVLRDKLKMDPLIRFVDKFKAANTIPPSYRVFLLNGETFDIYFESFSLMIKIKEKEYYIGDLDERNYAIKHINRLLQEPIATPGSEGEEDSESPSTPPPTTPPAEEPAEEEPAA